MVVLSSQISLIATIIKEGIEAIGTFFGYRWAGIDNEDMTLLLYANDEITRNPVYR